MAIPEIIKKIEKAELLGRGCGTFPTAKKWSAVFSEKDTDKYVICNGSESEPGIFKDQFILENHPERVLDGMSIAIKTLNAKKGFVYLNPIFNSRFRRKLQILIGDDPIEIFAKPVNDYIGGEESAIINLMEGKREEPRFKPPYVTSNGLFGKPTLVNNIETFYDINLISNDEYKAERFFCISGDNTPDNIYRYPVKLSIKEALLKSGNYPNFKFFIQLGGAMAGTCLAEDDLESYNVENFSGLVIHELDKDKDKLISNWLEFYKNESCGQCVPCREGTYRLYQMYQDGKVTDKLFSDILFTMQNTSLCSLGKMATTAIASYHKNILGQPFDLGKSKIEKCDK
jgi:NADH:ubiquinone oxidoreductase subunit F (NADH-binding)